MKKSGLLACGLLVLASCRQIIGVEKAEVDPTLTGAGRGGGGGAMNALETGGSTLGGAAQAGESGLDDVAGASSGGEGGAGTPTPTLCEDYCTTVLANCTAAFAVYTSYEACLGVCAALPAGSEGEQSGNSVQCRLHAARQAPDEVPYYCPSAGPGGNGLCGSNCEGLCTLRESVCAEYSMGDVPTCLSDCAKLTDQGVYSTDLSVGQYSGAHVQCRLYHVSAAASAAPEQHCTHVDGAAPCD